MANEKASSLWKPVRVLVKWSSGNINHMIVLWEQLRTNNKKTNVDIHSDTTFDKCRVDINVDIFSRELCWSNIDDSPVSLIFKTIYSPTKTYHVNILCFWKCNEMVTLQNSRCKANIVISWHDKSLIWPIACKYPQGPFILTWMITSLMTCGVKLHPSSNFSGATVEIREWVTLGISNFVILVSAGIKVNRY